MNRTRLAPRGGTIFWGGVLLLLATVTAVTVVLGSWSWSAVVWLVVLFGGLMVVAGLIGGIARAIIRPRWEPAAAAPSNNDDASTTPRP